MHFSLRREGAIGERFCASSMTTTTNNETTTTVCCCSSSSLTTTRKIRTDDARRWRGRMTQRTCEQYTVAKVFVALFAGWECACLVRGNEESFEQKEELS